MYWPVAPSRVLRDRHANPIISLARHRKGTLFATISKDEVVVWNVRPTVRLSSVDRSPGSISKYGDNVSLSWSHDGKSLLLLTSYDYVIHYHVISTGTPVYHHPPAAEFPPGPGEGEEIGGLLVEVAGVSRVEKRCTSLASHSRYTLASTSSPATLIRIPWPTPRELISRAVNGDATNLPTLDGDEEFQVDVEKWALKDLPWLDRVGEDVTVEQFEYSRTLGMHTLILSDGRAFVVHFRSQAAATGVQSPAVMSPPAGELVTTATSNAGSTTIVGRQVHPLIGGRDADPAAALAVNPKFGLAAIGTNSGNVHAVSLPIHPQLPRHSHTYSVSVSASTSHPIGAVRSLSWTSDGYGLAVGYDRGWAVWSVGGRLCGYGVKGEEEEEGDAFMRGVKELFWLPGNLELVMLAAEESATERLYILPFAKSSNTSQQTPDSARHALLQLDDKVLVYRGADQPDMSVINPESDVWQAVKYPMLYISINWPIRYASISADGKLIAIAGRYGLTHFSSISGRWKLFRDEVEEKEITVRGGMIWYHHVLVAAVETDTSNELRLYSRDLELSNANVLHAEHMQASVLLMSLFDNSLLVYTADNMLHHFLIEATKDTIRLNSCGSISFRGIVAMPNRVRGMSWMIPAAQKALGDPEQDLLVATIIFLVDSRLVLLRPRRAGNNEVRYDMQVLADHIESYWTHLSGISTLENSLWGYDGSSIRVWLDALTVEATVVNSETDAYVTVQESVKLDVDFYPLSILMDKAIVIGVDHEVSQRRGLPFTLFKIQSGAHLFLPAVLRYHLDNGHVDAAVSLAACYDQLVYFNHALEVLLYRVLEVEEAASKTSPDDKEQHDCPLLKSAIAFLDHFPQSLDIVVACARKTETTRWSELFAVAGDPRGLYEKCIKRGLLKTASSYLLVMHTINPDRSGIEDTIHLLKLAMSNQDVPLAKDLLRFSRGLDDTGNAFDTVIKACRLA